jgi:hypothetical protein
MGKSPLFLFLFLFFTYLYKEKKSEKTILNTNLHFMKHDSQSIELSFKTIQLSKLVIKLESKTYFITNLVLYSQYIYIFKTIVLFKDNLVILHDSRSNLTVHVNRGTN